MDLSWKEKEARSPQGAMAWSFNRSEYQIHISHSICLSGPLNFSWKSWLLVHKPLMFSSKRLLSLQISRCKEFPSSRTQLSTMTDSTWTPLLDQRYHFDLDHLLLLPLIWRWILILFVTNSWLVLCWHFLVQVHSCFLQMLRTSCWQSNWSNA